MEDVIGYGRWGLVVFYLILVGLFVYGILRPRTRVEWRSMGLAQAFVVALYAEMYGLPLTLYGVAWLTGQSEYVSDHFHGHAWPYLFGWGDWGAVIFDVVGQALILVGAGIALLGWRTLYRHRDGVALGGVYRWVRHPQYLGFVLFLTGSVVNWPTLPTLLMYPVLVATYYRLARAEEQEMRERASDAYGQYAASTGFLIPGLGKAPSDRSI